MTRDSSNRKIAIFAFIAGATAVALAALVTKGAQARKALANLGRPALRARLGSWLGGALAPGRPSRMTPQTFIQLVARICEARPLEYGRAPRTTHKPLVWLISPAPLASHEPAADEHAAGSDR